MIHDIVEKWLKSWRFYDNLLPENDDWAHYRNKLV